MQEKATDLYQILAAPYPFNFIGVGPMRIIIHAHLGAVSHDLAN
jgi:hypothetical protein